MTAEMALLARYRLSLVIVLAALAATAGLFAFAKPQYHPRYESTMFDLADRHHYVLAEVRAAFAKHGLPLRYDNAPSEPLWLSSEPGPWPTDAFYVHYVARRTGQMSWGPEFPDQWEQRVGNLLVHYGGDDAAVLARVKAAVDELD